MSRQVLPVTSYAVLGLLTFGDELTGYEIKQRADVTLRFYWTSPAMSQIYSELARLTGHGLIEARVDAEGGRERTTYAITPEGQAALREWMDNTPAGFPVLKHTVCLRLLMGHVTEPERVRKMIEEYVDELAGAIEDLRAVRDKDRRKVGRMHRDTRADVDQRVEAVLPTPREAGIAALQPARHVMLPEIPAARPLQDVAADRRHIP